MSAPRILIVDDQTAVREELAYALKYEGYRTAEAAHGEAGRDALREGDIHVALVDIKMPGMDGMQLLQKVQEDHAEVPVIMITGHGDIETAVVALRNGAFDFLPKPFDTDRVLVSIKNALQVRELTSENLALRTELAKNHRILGTSAEIEAVRNMIERVAPTQAQVLITGENGTGKELVARQVHALSNRHTEPFVAVNCAAIPHELIESELFGHERGAFTGADRARIGHFEHADGGTLFLDEIGDMPLAAQAKLLRTLQDGVVTRLGGNSAMEVDVRVVAATNQDLEQLVEEKLFRQDLYYRLHVIRIHVPPLRSRAADIDELGATFVAAACSRNQLDRRRLSKAALAWLRTQPWPGNVRQLKNLIEAAAILADGDEIGVEELDAMSASQRPATPTAEDMFSLETLTAFRAASEREFIRRKLEENSGNIKRTAERIEIQRSNLYKKLDRYGLK